MDVDIRPAGPDEADAVLDVIRAAFGAAGSAHGTQVADLWAEVRAGDHLLIELVAVADGDVVGHVGISHCWVDARRELVDACMLSPLSTARSGRTMGSGRYWGRHGRGGEEGRRGGRRTCRRRRRRGSP